MSLKLLRDRRRGMPQPCSSMTKCVRSGLVSPPASAVAGVRCSDTAGHELGKNIADPDHARRTARGRRPRPASPRRARARRVPALRRPRPRLRPGPLPSLQRRDLGSLLVRAVAVWQRRAARARGFAAATRGRPDHDATTFATAASHGDASIEMIPGWPAGWSSRQRRRRRWCAGSSNMSASLAPSHVATWTAAMPAFLAPDH